MFAASRWDAMVEDDAVGVAWINMHIIYRFVSAFVTLRGAGTMAYLPVFFKFPKGSMVIWGARTMLRFAFDETSVRFRRLSGV